MSLTQVACRVYEVRQRGALVKRREALGELLREASLLRERSLDIEKLKSKRLFELFNRIGVDPKTPVVNIDTKNIVSEVALKIDPDMKEKSKLHTMRRASASIPTAKSGRILSGIRKKPKKEDAYQAENSSEHARSDYRIMDCLYNPCLQACVRLDAGHKISEIAYYIYRFTQLHLSMIPDNVRYLGGGPPGPVC